jgi:HK97 gp10 family phage protein
VKTDSKPIRADVLAALTELPEVVATVREVAKDIAEDARNLAPVRTGNLKRKGIGIEKRRNSRGKVYYVVGWTPDGWYGELVEFGTEDTTARPHLVPAAVKNGAVSAGDTE